MNLDIKNWKRFCIGDLFDIRSGKYCCNEEIYSTPGDFVVVQGGENNFGCFGKIDKQYCIDNQYRPIGRNKFYKEFEKSHLVSNINQYNHQKTYVFNMDFYTKNPNSL